MHLGVVRLLERADRFSAEAGGHRFLRSARSTAPPATSTATASPELVFANNNSQEKSYYLYRGGQEGFSDEAARGMEGRRPDRHQAGRPGSRRPLGPRSSDHRKDRAEIFRGDGRGSNDPLEDPLHPGAAERRTAALTRTVSRSGLPEPPPRRQQVSFVYWGSADRLLRSLGASELPTLSATDAARPTSMATAGRPSLLQRER